MLGIFFGAILPAPMLTLFPMVALGSITELPPIQTLFPGLVYTAIGMLLAFVTYNAYKFSLQSIINFIFNIFKNFLIIFYFKVKK